jgi:lipoprotein-anchoring transpeptidase ErfK/SrfK
VRSKTFIAVAALVALLVGGAVGVYAYDAARADEVAPGITVGGIDVGGLDREAAGAKLRTELLEPLRAPVVVRSRGRRFRLTAHESKVRADVDAMIDDAIARGRDDNVLVRTARGLAGGEVDADVEPRVTYSHKAVGFLVYRVRRSIDRPPRNAKVQFAAAGLQRERSRVGLRVARNDLLERVEHALVRPAQHQRIVTAKVRRIQPKITTGELAKRYGTVVTIDRGGFTLRLFKRLKLVKSYPIAVGQVGLETPAGLYDVQNKAVNPAWHVPNSAWAGDMAGQVIPPGPQNPIKARWLGIYAGAGIHGTDAAGSIGTNASHGCIRMLIPDVVELYDKVPVGAPVYIA